MNKNSSSKPVFTREDLKRLHAPAPPDIRACLDEPYTLDPARVDEYQEKGYVKLENIISGEPLAYYRDLIGLAVGHRFRDDQRALAEKRVYEQSFLQAFNLWPHLPCDCRIRTMLPLRRCRPPHAGGRRNQTLV